MMLHRIVFICVVLLTAPVFGGQQHAAGAPDGNRTGNGTSHSKGHGKGLHIAAVAYEEVRDPLIFTIVVLLTGISKIGYHHANFLSSRVPESCILIILGTVFGAIIHFSGISKDLPDFFRPHEFFIFLLPPIILEASFSLHDRTFSENIGSILLFAVLGTVLACALLGGTLYGLAQVGAITDLSFLKIMVFSSLIVAVDPVAVLAVFNEIGVNRVLYFLVFGESLLNDGVTVVLYKVFQAYSAMPKITAVHILLGIIKFFVVCLGGLLLGVLAGIATAILTKYATHVKVVQPIIIYTMAYFGFLLAEMFEFSGIISIIGCGLTQVQYAFQNISDKSRTTMKYFTKVISSANEIIIFLFLGLSMVNDEHDWRTGFTLWTIVLCLVYRFIIIFGMSFAINGLDIYRVRKISLHEQFMISYGGLRGAVCFSLVALLDPVQFAEEKKIFMTTTLAVIIFTVFIQGITIKPLVHFLQISLAPEKSRTMYKELNSHVTDHMMAGIECIIGDHGRNHLREKLDYIDGKYLKPLLQVTPDPVDSQLKAFYDNLLLKEHYNYLKLSGAKTPGDVPDLPHVNTQLLLSSLAGDGDNIRELPVLERVEFTPKRISQPGIRSAPATPAITIEMDNDGLRYRSGRGKRSMSVDGGDINAKGLRSLLLSQRNSRMVLSRYDRNLTSNEDMRTEITKKTRRNKQLERLKSHDSLESPAHRRTSWSDSKAQVCEERTQVHKHPPPRHAMTVDLGNTNRFGTADDSFSPDIPFTPASILDSVFEEDEGVEEQPMLDRDKSSKKVRGSIKSGKYKLERQMGLDKTGPDGKRALPEQENKPSDKQGPPEETKSKPRTASDTETTV